MAIRISEETARQLFLANNLEPIADFPGTQKPWKSKCLITGKVVSPTYGKVRDYGHRCEYCSGFKVDPEDAIQFMLSSGFEPLVDYPGGNKPWKCRCTKCNRETNPSYSSVKRGTGCKFCSNRAVSEIDAVRAMSDRGFKTLTPFPGALNLWMVECVNCHRKFETYFHSLKTNKRCKFCAGKTLDLESVLEKMRELNLKPLEPFRNARAPWTSECLICGHTVQPTWMRIKSGRGHCAYCAQRRVDLNDARKLFRDSGLEPISDFPGSNKPWKSKCKKCGSECSPRYSDIRRGQGGCSSCADFGINLDEPGYLYLISHLQLKAHKVGIGNSRKEGKSDDRIYKHEKEGWVLVRKENFLTTRQARELELAILGWLRNDVSIPAFLKSSQMPQGGWTETFSSEMLDIAEVEIKLDSMLESKRA